MLKIYLLVFLALIGSILAVIPLYLRHSWRPTTESVLSLIYSGLLGMLIGIAFLVPELIPFKLILGEEAIPMCNEIAFPMLTLNVFFGSWMGAYMDGYMDGGKITLRETLSEMSNLAR